MNPKQSLASLNEFEIGYVCGLLTGEGSFTGDKKHANVSVKLKFDDVEPLLFLQEKLGGNLYGPYTHGGRHYRLWRLMGTPLFASLGLFDRNLPPSRKREQFEVWLERYGLRAALPERIVVPCLTASAKGKIDPRDAGYIMGLVVGEGSFTGDRLYPSLQVGLVATDPAPLTLLQKLFGGRVYRKPGIHQPQLVWLLRGPDLHSSIHFFSEYLPASKKRLQFERWLLRYHLICKCRARRDEPCIGRT